MFFFFFALILFYKIFLYKFDNICLFTIIFISWIFSSIYIVVLNRQKIKKKCFVNCLFKEESFLFKLFNRYFFIYSYSIFLSLFYTFVLLIFILKIDMISLIFTFIGIFVSYYFFKKIYKKSGLKEEYNKWILFSLFSIWSASFLILMIIVKNYYFSSIPSYIDLSLIKTFNNLNIIYHSNCLIINTLLNLSNFLDALNNWLITNVFLNSTGIVKVIAGINFIFVSFIGIFAMHYLLFFTINYLEESYENKTKK